MKAAVVRAFGDPLVIEERPGPDLDPGPDLGPDPGPDPGGTGR